VTDGGREVRRSLAIYGALIALVAALGAWLSAAAPGRVPAGVDTPSWREIVPIGVLGALGVVLSARSGFPPLWTATARIGWWRRLVVAATIGMAAGGLLVALDKVHPLAIPQVPFPLSVPFYVCAGVLLEIAFRLFPLPLVVWLLSTVVMKGRRQRAVFVAAVVVLSCIEPVSQVAGMRQVAKAPIGDALLVALFAFIYAVNVGAALLFRAYGFWACVTMRLGLYAVWHMAS